MTRADKPAVDNDGDGLAGPPARHPKRGGLRPPAPVAPGRSARRSGPAPIPADGCGPAHPPASPDGCGRDARADECAPTPLEVLLAAMHRHWRARRYDKAAALARDAAPYLHPRLTRVAHQGGIALRHEDALAELD